MDEAKLLEHVLSLKDDISEIKTMMIEQKKQCCEHAGRLTKLEARSGLLGMVGGLLGGFIAVKTGGAA